MLMTPTRKLTAIALVIAFIQFTNALEYMVFNPIFLYMAADFSVPVSYAGYVSAAYTLAAVISGIGAFFWIGGVEKQRFLMLNVTLLGVTTLLIATTQQFYWLLALRLLAGLLGGTTMGVGIGLLLNAAPAALHGRMLATVIASFSLVSIVGMPGMLYLCEVASWHVALAAIGGLCLLAAVLVALFVPRDAPQPQAAAPVTLDRRLLLFAAAAGLTQFSPMLLIPVLAPLLTQRLQVVDAHLSWLFFIGGVAGYLATVLAGRWLQRFGAVTLTVGATLLLLGSLWLVARGGDRGELFMVAFLAAAFAVPAFDQFTRLAVTLLRRFQQRLRRRRSIITLPAIRRMFSAAAWLNSVSTDCGCTVPNTSAVVVPLLNNSRRKKADIASACCSQP